MTTLASFPAEWTVRQARDAYLAENGFTVEAYDDTWTQASFLGIRIAVPNTRGHRWAIMLHDLHHVATGFGTNLIGEGEISVWELRHGWRALGLYVGGIVLAGALLGGLQSPRRAREAWRHAEQAQSLFARHPRTDEAAYAELLELTVGDLRASLGVPSEGLTRGPRELHDYAPAR